MNSKVFTNFLMPVLILLAFACHIPSDPCLDGDLVCENGGICTSGACECATGFEGSNCTILSRNKWSGTWDANELCDGGARPEISVIIAASAADDLEVNIINFNGIMDDYGIYDPLVGRVSGPNTISISQQLLIRGTDTIRFSNGTGTYVHKDSIRFSYYVYPGNGDVPVTCTSGLTR